MPRKRRWPTWEESDEKLKQGIIDDTKANVPPYGLEEWEIWGKPAPEKDEEDVEQRESA